MGMKRFFAPNISGRGRWFRGLLAAAMLIPGLLVCAFGHWAGLLLVVAGGFTLFEALRGWCVMRACGVRTKL